MTCKAPTSWDAIPSPGTTNNFRSDTSMFVFYNSFGGSYPAGNRVKISGWTFQGMDGVDYTKEAGTENWPQKGKMAWSSATRESDGAAVWLPFYKTAQNPPVNVYA